MYEIRSDFRAVLQIFTALADPDLDSREKCYITLKCLFKDFESIPPEDIAEAAEKAYWFADGGDIPKGGPAPVRIIDWQQDEHLIFPAVNKAAGFETRAVKYLHWWTFLGLFAEVGEGLFSQVMSIRTKRAKGKKLDKWEQEFLREHKHLVELKARLTEEEQAAEQADEEFLKELLGE
ncbi:MAG: hypothetical protein IJ740_08220 [Ruminococcus sp.]|nr:hypothetical protein [Ruminococcus sp.]